MQLVEHISTLVSSKGEEPHSYIRDEHLPVSPTSCGHDGRERRTQGGPRYMWGTLNSDHSAAYAPKTMPAADGDMHLDCPCDIECPRCHSQPGQFCTTLDGGGASGGGYHSKWHTVRIKASPRCRALATGERSRCEYGDHDWQATDEPEVAGCTRCPAKAPYRPAAR